MIESINPNFYRKVNKQTFKYHVEIKHRVRENPFD